MTFNTNNIFNQAGSYNPEYLNDIIDNEMAETLNFPTDENQYKYSTVEQGFSYTPLPSLEEDNASPYMGTRIKSAFTSIIDSIKNISVKEAANKVKDKVASTFANAIKHIKGFIKNHEGIQTLGLSIPMAALYFAGAIALGHAAILGVGGVGCIAAVMAISGPILHAIINKASA